MQTLYATHLPLPHRENGEELQVAVDALVRWVSRRFGVQPRPLAGGQATGMGASVNWSMLSGEAGGLFGIWVDQPDTTDSGWRWRTYADVGVENQRAWFRVRVHLYSDLEGLLTSPRVLAGRPGVVRQITDELHLTVDGQPLGVPLRVTATNTGHYLALLESQSRRLPIIAISQLSSGETFIDPEGTADKLLGLAHVAILDDTATRLVTESIGKQLSCYRGAVRVYWPRMKGTDDPFHHRLYVGGALEFLGPSGLQSELFLTLGRLAGLTIDEPELRRRLLLEARTAAVERSVEIRAAALAKVSQVATDRGAVSAEEFSKFAAEYDELDARYTELDLDAVELQREVERVRQERDNARASLVELSLSFARSNVAETATSVLRGAPLTILDAVELAKSDANYSIVLDEALSSAADSQYGDPSRVLDDLRLVEEIARDWGLGELTSGPHQAFKQRCSAYRDGIGHQAGTRYRADYERLWQNNKIMLGPHIARGVGPVASILRIYFYFDTATKTIVVGHVGRKLRDDSNKN